MNDQEVLFTGISFCLAHTKRNGDCKDNCPLSDHICIDREGDLRFCPAKDEMNYVKFTEDFRYMIKILSEWKEKQH